ncbi:putative secreted protein (Por secretion system target) [Marinoscillum furvescens DSM 4134]|uniref:Putative secreted protein (Por secretion system target) n=2 Tax=Marinoscillum furvescens TaxID=1026 RepID=A0A3D9L2Z8_MARFU|nr:putative secreted protein (Por secretion system target) [Marinoscillum furvescens DSM 4134]
MKNQQPYLAKLACLILLLAAGPLVLAQQAPPSAVAGLYNASVDWSVSDDFNSLNWSKWTYRKDDGTNGIGEGSNYVYIVNNSYVSLKGSGATDKGGGLSSLNPTHYGFYITKFRLLGGFPEDHSTAWHPSIWASPWNMGSDARQLNPLPSDWVEIDFMEYIEQWPSFWHTQLIPRLNNVTEPVSGRPLLYTRDTNFGSWTTLGLEYHPDYFQLWELTNGTWTKKGTKIYTSGYENTTSKIHYKCRSQVYWILSNKYHYAGGWYQGDSWMHVDYFYYYPYNGSSRNDLSHFEADNPQSNMGLEQVSLSPNPTHGLVSLANLANGTYEVTVVDLLGKTALEQTINVSAGSYSMDVATLPKGTYVLKIKSREGSRNMRFIKY